LATHWALLLHFYQPPIQLPYVLRQIACESYRPLIQLLADNPHARVTVNISGVLTEMLIDNAHQDVVEGLAWLAERGQVEFTGSAK
jgi:alpha-amylase/alpha-mannosidase (GH57 family)